MRIEKKYFSVEETLERWRMPERDLGYLAENDELRLSVRVYDLELESGYLHPPTAGSHNWVRECSELYTGLVDLYAGDAYMIFRCAETFLDAFRLPCGKHLRVVDGGEPLHVMLGDLLVRRDERNRLEKLRGFKGAGLCLDRPGFSASMDFRNVCCAGTHFHLGDVQARVVQELHRTAEAGEPWQSGKRLLTHARSRSMRMADVFKSQPNWRELIESNRRGHYRLKVHPDQSVGRTQGDGDPLHGGSKGG